MFRPFLARVLARLSNFRRNVGYYSVMPLEAPADRAEREARSIALERAYVHDSYDRLATHLSNARYQPWPQVKKFLDELEVGAVVCDVGCGNGKYLNVNPNTVVIGCDRSRPLVGTAKDRKAEVLVSDALSLPFRDETFDAAICIAVIHHLATRERRIQALKELARVLRVGGRLLVTVWAKEQKHRKFESQDVLIPWRPPERSSSEDVESSIERESLSTVNATDDEGFHSQAEAHSDIDRTPGRVIAAVKPATHEPPTSDPIGASEEPVTSRRRPRGRLRRIDPSPQNHPLLSQSSSELSSPSETCYSFVRRALQKLTSGKRTHSEEADGSRSSSRSSERNKETVGATESKSFPVREENPFNCPIELRLLEPEDVESSESEDRCPRKIFMMSSPVMALKSVTEKLATRSRSLTSLLNSAVKIGWNDLSIFQQDIMPQANPTNHVAEMRSYYAYHAPEHDISGIGSLSSTSETPPVIVRSQSSEPRLTPTVSTSYATSMSVGGETALVSSDGSQEGLERRRPTLVKQRGFYDDDDIAKNRLSAVKEVSVEKSSPRLMMPKQTSLNENLIHGVEHEAKKLIKKQTSLREDVIAPTSRSQTAGIESRSTQSTAQSSLQRLRDSFTRMTSSMSQTIRMSSSDISESSFKASFVKMIQQFRSEVRSRSSSPSKVPSEVRTSSKLTRIHSADVPGCTTLSPSRRAHECLSRAVSETSRDEMVQRSPSRTFLERKLTREEGSDSSKDSSLQSDTSVDSEDSCVSVIFIPKEALLASKQEAEALNSLSPKTRNSSSSSSSDNSFHDNKSPPKSPALTLAQRRALANSKSFSPSPVFSTPISKSDSRFVFPEKSETAQVPLAELVVPSVMVSAADSVSQSTMGATSDAESKASLAAEIITAPSTAVVASSPPVAVTTSSTTAEPRVSALASPIPAPLWKRRTQSEIALPKAQEIDNVEAIIKKPQGFKKRYVPRMLSYEIFNPETDDLDSDSDAASTPDSASATFDSDKIWKLRKVFSEAAKQKDMESSDSDGDDTATRFAKNRRSTILASGISFVPTTEEIESTKVKENAESAETLITDDGAPEPTDNVLRPLEDAMKEMERRVEPERLRALDKTVFSRESLMCIAEEAEVKSILPEVCLDKPVIMRRPVCPTTRVGANLGLPLSFNQTRHSIAATELLDKERLELSSQRQVQSLDNTRPRLIVQKHVDESWEKDREKQILLDFMKELTTELDQEMVTLECSSFPSTSSFGEASTGSSFSSMEYLKPKAPAALLSNKPTNTNPKLAPEFRDSSLSLSTSQDSLPSDSGGAPTLHRYYHVFSEGELDRLIERHVPNLDIVSSYYDHANWCIVAEKVHLWTI